MAFCTPIREGSDQKIWENGCQTVVSTASQKLSGRTPDSRKMGVGRGGGRTAVLRPAQSDEGREHEGHFERDEGFVCPLLAGLSFLYAGVDKW